MTITPPNNAAALLADLGLGVGGFSALATKLFNNADVITNQTPPWQIPLLIYKASDQLDIGTTFTDIAGMGVSIGAGETWAFDVWLLCDADASTTGIDTTMNGPAAPTIVSFVHVYPTSTSANDYRVRVAYQVSAAASSAGANKAVFEMRGIVVNGVNAGTLTPQAKREAVGTGPNVRAGSIARYWRLA